MSDVNVIPLLLLFITDITYILTFYIEGGQYKYSVIPFSHRSNRQRHTALQRERGGWSEVRKEEAEKDIALWCRSVV
jgi:hypothetical protein